MYMKSDVADADRPDKSLSDSDKSGATSGAGANDTVQSSNVTQKRDDADRKRRMADRPLPVPVEVEPYYRDVDRSEAEKLLAGCEDGAFVLRPSSQACHAYTLSVCCGGTVHNIGVRRRPDGQLALGFARRGEKCHPHAAALLEYHQKRHLVLRPVGQGGTIGRVILTGPPDHYKVPVHPPKPVASDNII
ncbi:hypothetical protein EVAR_19810_1 [Eumeta japonica]|uniref:SH2 domain-containing protein n=1 Tax=Eumeta variegata TaxID=151549 RepID=A0A4C1UQP8_EUMVA|nr:hypothetical protein EVAR_19810_1 [Eumeta japonica]